MDSNNVEIIFTNGGGQMKNKLMSFFKRNGFLLFLFICVCVVAVGTIYIATQDMRIAKDPLEEDLVILEEIKDDEEKENIEVSSIEEPIVDKELNPEVDEAVVEENNIDEEVVAEEIMTEDDAIEEAINAEEIEYVDDYEEEDDVEDDVEIIASQSVGTFPVEGKVMTEFSTDNLSYSITLDEWRAHNGIDIVAPLGTNVKAPLKGTVKEVREDDLWGIIIVIDHGDGLESRLSNLGTMEMVKEGLEVNSGDFISTVGATANIEMAMDSHVHFEVTKNGKIVDPRSITN